MQLLLLLLLSSSSAISLVNAACCYTVDSNVISPSFYAVNITAKHSDFDKAKNYSVTVTFDKSYAVTDQFEAPWNLATLKCSRDRASSGNPNVFNCDFSTQNPTRPNEFGASFKVRVPPQAPTANSTTSPNITPKVDNFLVFNQACSIAESCQDFTAAAGGFKIDSPVNLGQLGVLPFYVVLIVGLILAAMLSGFLVVAYKNYKGNPEDREKGPVISPFAPTLPSFVENDRREMQESERRSKFNVFKRKKPEYLVTTIMKQDGTLHVRHQGGTSATTVRKHIPKHEVGESAFDTVGLEDQITIPMSAINITGDFSQSFGHGDLGSGVADAKMLPHGSVIDAKEVERLESEHSELPSSIVQSAVGSASSSASPSLALKPPPAPVEAETSLSRSESRSSRHLKRRNTDKRISTQSSKSLQLDRRASRSKKRLSAMSQHESQSGTLERSLSKRSRKSTLERAPSRSSIPPPRSHSPQPAGQPAQTLVQLDEETIEKFTMSTPSLRRSKSQSQYSGNSPSPSLSHSKSHANLDRRRSTRRVPSSRPPLPFTEVTDLTSSPNPTKSVDSHNDHPHLSVQFNHPPSAQSHHVEFEQPPYLEPHKDSAIRRWAENIAKAKEEGFSSPALSESMASVNSATAAKNTEPTRIRSPTGSSSISDIIDPAGTVGNEIETGNNNGANVGLGLSLSADNVSSGQFSNLDHNRRQDPRSNIGSDDDDDDKPLAMTLDRSLASALSSDLSRIVNNDNTSMKEEEKDEDDIPLAAVASTLSRSATPSLLHMSSLTNLRSSSNGSPLPQNNNNGVSGTGSASGVGSPVSRFEEDEEDQPLALVLETRETLKRKDEVLDEYFR